MGIDLGAELALKYLLVAGWIYFAHILGSQFRHEWPGLRGWVVVLAVSLLVAFTGGGVLATYEPTLEKQRAIVIAAFLISFIPAGLDHRPRA
ncbi:MAG TPA: hypothetical protein VMU57_02880 [Edaphobacter sp.]|uniref:hypothetical protein n=1 Tax=Edaphobacter sp. TaxID=1934404 RepID=UPI002B8214B5|nr:hypothetical protein [Edaphobacter sp.]HUZ93835.1 hypothetical protein [Edaphobacter sp.]